jgi:hypothetical protein
VQRFPNYPVLRRCAFNRCSILDTDARREQDNRRRKRPKQPPARTSQGSGQEGTLAAMKALWRELADPKIKEHHGPVVKTTRLAAKSQTHRLDPK